MILFKKAGALARYLDTMRQKGARIGFAPTMGALHNGHTALLDACKQVCDVSVCSIFVNPTQFNNPSDFRHYPSTLDRDIERLVQAGCHVLFLPARHEVYPPGFVAQRYELGFIETVLEGAYRPGHFQGVCQAVDQLLKTVNPDEVFFGQKDYQQCMVIKKLLEITGRASVKLNIIPTQRNADGLALSSRNLRLNAEQRARAVALFEALTFLKTHIAEMPLPNLKNGGMGILKSQGFDVDYVEVADAENLQPVTEAGSKKLVGLVAAATGGVRLIDNMLLN